MSDTQIVVVGGQAHAIDMGLVVRKLMEKKAADAAAAQGGIYHSDQDEPIDMCEDCMDWFTDCEDCDYNPDLAPAVVAPVAAPAVVVASKYILAVEVKLDDEFSQDTLWDVATEISDILEDVTGLEYETFDSFRDGDEDLNISAVVDRPISYEEIVEKVAKFKKYLSFCSVKVTPIPNTPSVLFEYKG